MPYGHLIAAATVNTLGHIPGHIPGAAAPSEALDPARGLCRLKSMKKPILLCRNLAKQFSNVPVYVKVIHRLQAFFYTDKRVVQSVCHSTASCQVQ